MDLLCSKCDVPHTIALQVRYNFPGVLQLPLECATTFHRNAYNYATASNGMLQKYQGALIQIPKTPLLIKHNISISIVGLSLGARFITFYIEELLFSCSKHITMKVLLLYQAILGELLAL